jgi:indole-3-glycerol phosphate synthase
MDALVEVHTVEEMRTANEIGANLIGVNNRNLKTFEVSLDVSRRLIEFASTSATLISESGVNSKDDIDQLSALGYSGFLIGETLMRSDDAEGSLRELIAAR